MKKQIKKIKKWIKENKATAITMGVLSVSTVGCVLYAVNDYRLKRDINKSCLAFIDELSESNVAYDNNWDFMLVNDREGNVTAWTK